MESYENLRLEKKDKIPKLSLFERLFKKSNRISEKNLNFLEERYNKSNALEQKSLQIKEEDFADFTIESPLKRELLLQNNLQENPQTQDFQKEYNAQENPSKTPINTSLNSSEREAALESAKYNINEIPFKMVLIVFVCMAVCLMLFAPKIYIRNNIYYASRSIIQLQAHIDSLNEENKHIKKQLEDIKFKNLTHELDF